MIPQTVQDFAGRWQINRVIDDAKAGQRVTGQGIARFIPEPSGHLVYEEALDMSFPGQPKPLHATRRYFWYGNGGVIEIYFEDGRLLQRFVLSDARAGDVHLCDPDRYDGVYDFDNWPEWQAIWTVTGPRKDYIMRTRYQRMG